MLLLAAVSFSEENLVVASVLLCTLFYALSAAALYRLALYLGFSRGLSFFAGIALLGTGRFVWAGASGMEPCAFAFPMLLCLRSHLADRERGAPGLLTALLAGLASCVRPEGYLLYLVLLTDHTLAYDPATKKFGFDFRPWPKARSVAAVALFAILIAPYILFCLSTNGRLFPNTYYAKLHEQFITFPMAYLAMAYRGLFWESKLWLALLAAVGVGWQMVWSYRGEGGERFAHFRRARVLWLWPVGFLSHSALFNPSLLPHFQRYLMPFIPLVVLFAVIGIGGVLRVPNLPRLQAPERSFRISIVVGAIAISLAMIPLRIVPWTDLLVRCVDNTNKQQVAVGKWIRDNTPPDAVVALHDAGAIAYYGERRIIDMLGLTTTGIMEIIYGRRDVPAFGSPEILNYVREREPEYIAVYGEWYGIFYYHSESFEKVFEADLGQDNVICGMPLKPVWKAHWEDFKDKPFISNEMFYGYAYNSYGYDE